MKKYLPVLITFTLLISCAGNRIYDQYITIPEHVWNNGNILHFNVNISDTSDAYNIYINVRNLNQYPYSNLYLFVTAYSPDNNTERDTVEIMLADDMGNWLGKGAASIFTRVYPYKTDIRFPEQGIYKFDIEQAMRVENLRYISDIGLRIETFEPKK